MMPLTTQLVFKILNPNVVVSTDVPGCQKACDDIKFFDCINAGEQAACRTLCETATDASIETFKACAVGLCDDNSCVVTFSVANP